MVAVTPCSECEDPELFFPTLTPGRGGNQYQIRRSVTIARQGYCGKCPIQAECLAMGLSNRENWGIWGGVYIPVKKLPGWKDRLER